MAWPPGSSGVAIWPVQWPGTQIAGSSGAPLRREDDIEMVAVVSGGDATCIPAATEGSGRGWPAGHGSSEDSGNPHRRGGRCAGAVPCLHAGRRRGLPPDRGRPGGRGPTHRPRELGRGGRRRIRGAGSGRHRPAGCAAGAGGQGCPVQKVRRDRRLAAVPGHARRRGHDPVHRRGRGRVRRPTWPGPSDGWPSTPSPRPATLPWDRPSTARTCSSASARAACWTSRT